MKKTLSTLAVVQALAGPAMATDTLPPAGDPVEAKIRTLVSSIPLAVDRAAYDLAEAAFAWCLFDRRHSSSDSRTFVSWGRR